LILYDAANRVGGEFQIALILGGVPAVLRHNSIHDEIVGEQTFRAAVHGVDAQVGWRKNVRSALCHFVDYEKRSDAARKRGNHRL
jgi:hypothetical protein